MVFGECYVVIGSKTLCIAFDFVSRVILLISFVILKTGNSVWFHLQFHGMYVILK